MPCMRRTLPMEPTIAGPVLDSQPDYMQQQMAELQVAIHQNKP